MEHARSVNESRRDALVGAVLLAAVLLAAAVVAGDGRAQSGGDDPGVDVRFVALDTLHLPPVGRVAGITWMGPDTLAVLMDVADTLSASGERETHLVFQDSLGVMFRREDFSGVLDRGLAWDGEFLYSSGDADDGSSILYRIGVDSLDVWQVDEAYDLPGHRPCDMAFDGRFVWIADRDNGRIDRFDPEVEEITRSAVTPGFSPVGLGWDGRNMWVTDAGTGRMYRLSGSRRTWSATVETADFLHRGSDVLLLDESGRVWYLPDGRNIAVRIRFQ
ncbi:hypothetical protein KDM41_01690 [bacterium]|nr:hypothetical protein [bacterium]